MKLHFEPNLPYQQAAIKAVCDLFSGQELCHPTFTVTKNAVDGAYLPGMESDFGIGNLKKLFDDDVQKNLREIQLRHGLRPSEQLDSFDFTIEMETGTGKTYVYQRTIFELHKKYGFTKFVIVVPSVAVKEGVYKSLQMTEDHFKQLYAGVPFDFFLYDSSKLGQVRNFATSPNIQIMVVTVGAINKKDVNNLYKESEKTGGEKPIDLIRATRPILIVDEPQSVDGGLEGRGKEALSAMNPLCTLRYSATHVHKHHMLYRLDAVDAYEQKLVKQIEVASAGIEGGHNKPFVRLLGVESKRGVISAKVELDVQAGAAVRRREATVHDGDDLEQATGRAMYQHCRIGEIRVEKGKQFVELRVPGGEHFLKVGEAYGDVEPLAVQREMIRRTIKEHLDKELRLRPQGIKVLSLFFVDAVDRYRKYDEAGNPVKGDYARIFEEEYRRLIKHPDYRTLFEGLDAASTAEEVHNGYFSIDKKGGWTDTAENNQANRDNAERAYNLIMREKEKLLDFQTPLKFIFSHSALREGWDNPNVFQICALREMGTDRQRRQTIGRGMRICRNQAGERVPGFEVNTLTVVAMEAYEDFAANLQHEIEEDTGIRFGIVEPHEFMAVTVSEPDGKSSALGIEKSKKLWDALRDARYVDAKGKILDALRKALKEDALELPEEFAAQLPQIAEILRKRAGRLEIKDASERKPIKTRQAVLKSEEFKALWDRIKHKTTYRVQFDNEELIKKCTAAIANGPTISKTRLQWRKADLAIAKSGVEATETSESAPIFLEEGDVELPDLITELQDRTQLTRRSIVRILTQSGRLDDFRRNPQQFIDVSGDAINRTKRMVIVDGIKYQRLGEEHYFAQELFETTELSGYLKNMIDAQRNVYEQVVYDSELEKSFAQQLEKNEAVRVYAKLPGWFKVPTPLGTYNPDWAVLIEQDGAERLYLVVETKSGLFLDDIREREAAKIQCGEAHFKALDEGENGAKFKKAQNVADLFG
ncbi:MAG: DEAD/DEAH box helicase family protein [Gemmataceae bacterium]|nr:DEAD/DEAH box helicase family protein [Gemmataceae bacterium]